jgi:NAD(P)-dependent dehydrogenase (short-subunit alcohol dehydrogenase family)
MLVHKRVDVRFSDLQDKVVLITGAAKGIGRAMALAFAKQGSSLVLFDLDAAGLSQLEQRLCEQGVQVMSVVGSVTAPEDVQRAVMAAIQAHGRVDILLNNAGISMNKPSIDLTPEDWRRTIDIDLTGVFFCCQAAARQMIKQGSGVIISTASMYGVVAAANRTAYCSAKAGVVALTKSLAVEWAPYGIRVNALCPGYIETDLVREIIAAGGMDREEIEARIPQGQLGSPEQMADVALFMASEVSAYMTGHALLADGGWTADSFKKNRSNP